MLPVSLVVMALLARNYYLRGQAIYSQRMIDREQIRTAAYTIGFDAVRFATSAPPDHAEYQAAWLAAGMHGKMDYLQKRAALRAGELSSALLLDGAQSVIVVAVSYHFSAEQAKDDVAKGTIARYARGQDYHPLLWDKLRQLGEWLETAYPGGRTRGFCDSGPIRERELAARAGLGWQGKHTNLISLDLGNWFFLGALLTTLAIEPDAAVANHCGTCTRCLAACPTGALVAPMTLDARRCISYLTIEHKGPMPRELRPLIGDRIFGCDDCLAACPWNEKAQIGRETRLATRDTEAAHPDLLALLALLADDKGFKARFAGTALLRPKREGLRRNVCVALGNVGGVEAIVPLSNVLHTDSSTTVRGAAAWGLGEIAKRTGRQEVKTVLIAASETEEDNTVREEIAYSLSAK